MDNQTCVSCQERLSCGDSPLSITGNVIGLLTFAGAVYIGAQVYIESMRTTNQRFRKLMDTVMYRISKLNGVSRLVPADRVLESDPERRKLYSGKLGLERSTARDKLGKATMEALQTYTGLGEDSIRKKGPLWFYFRLRKTEKDLAGALKRLEEASFSLRVVAEKASEQIALDSEYRETRFRELVTQELKELREDMEDLKQTLAEDSEEDHRSVQDSVEPSTHDLVEENGDNACAGADQVATTA